MHVARIKRQKNTYFSARIFRCNFYHKNPAKKMVKMDIYKHRQIGYNEKADWESPIVCEAQLTPGVAEYQSHGIKHATTDPGCAFPLPYALSD